MSKTLIIILSVIGGLSLLYCACFNWIFRHASVIEMLGPRSTGAEYERNQAQAEAEP